MGYCIGLLINFFQAYDFYLVSYINGWGNTFKLAFEIGIHDTIGIDLVNIILAKKNNKKVFSVNVTISSN